MQNNRFVVLTGHLSNYPLSDLVGILRHQRKSGRLLIEFPKGPATFFFQNGELIDARMNDLTGLQAICVALAEPDASFNFNPLIMSPRRTIDPSFQRAVAELFGCWDESALQIESTVTPASIEGAAVAPDALRTLTGRRSEPLALPAGPSSPAQRHSLLLISAVIVMVGLSTLIAVTGGFTKSDVATAAPAAAAPLIQPLASGVAPVGAQPETPVHKAAPAAAKASHVLSERKEEKRAEPETQTEPASAPEAAQSAQAVKVVMQIENGRVLKASIANHKPGMDSYEALALRIARQRRYPATHTGGETVTISVNR